MFIYHQIHTEPLLYRYYYEY